MTSTALPLREHRFVADGGLETDLIFHHGLDLPHFASFPLIDSEAGRAQLRRYYDGYAAVARRAGAGLMLDTPTWRANPDWGARLGYDATALARVNADSVAFLHQVRDAYAPDLAGRPVFVNGVLGPRGDGYVALSAVDPAEAAEYHAPQLAAFAAARADGATAVTLTQPGEAIGIVRAARDIQLPIGISFTVETDGRLPNGDSLAHAIAVVDEAAAPDYYLVNCAHPTHMAHAFNDPALARERILGIRPNASRRSHAELDEAVTLDEGDPSALAADTRAIASLLPAMRVLGGCCGTDARHVAALWDIAAS